MNPFTHETRDRVLSVNLPDLCTKLRAPCSLQRLLMSAKPDHMGLGDFLLKSAFDQHLLTLIVGGRYREVQTTLVAHFGPADHETIRMATGVASTHKGSVNGR